MLQASKKFFSICKNITTPNAIESFILTTGKHVVHRTNTRIKVQTTSSSRRKAIKRLKNPRSS